MNKLSGFRNIHAGEKIIVCGLGESLNTLTNPHEFITIGVNDIGRKFDPTYLVVMNGKDSFVPERWRWIETSWGKNIFTQLHDLDGQKGIIHFNLGKRAGTNLDSDDSLPYTSNSPYVALCLAAYMGARVIGMIGVDFTDNHFWQKDGAHKLTRQLAKIDREYQTLYHAFLEKDHYVYNLSEQSRLTAFPKITMEEFKRL
jgi:hypothetical protein